MSDENKLEERKKEAKKHVVVFFFCKFYFVKLDGNSYSQFLQYMYILCIEYTRLLWFSTRTRSGSKVGIVLCVTLECKKLSQSIIRMFSFFFFV